MKSLLGVLALSVALQAIGIAPAVADAADREARAQFNQGVELYEQGKFDQAAIAFERAFELKPSFRILFNIGQVENELGHYALALQAYTRYLEEGGQQVEPQRRELVTREVERLKTLVGSIEVTGEPAGAQVQVDDETRGALPLDGPVLVNLGKHLVVVRSGGEEIYREKVKVAGGETVRVAVQQRAETAAPAEDGPPAEPEPTVAEPDEEPGRLWTWVAFGVGAAAGIAGGVVGGLSVAKKNELVDDCDDGSCGDDRIADRDTVKTMSLTADVLFGVAAAGIVTGAVLYFVEPGDGEGAVAVSPTASADGAGLSVAGRF